MKPYEQPITENKEFIEVKNQQYYNTHADINGIVDYQLGAKETQTILIRLFEAETLNIRNQAAASVAAQLNEAHDNEIVEFADWLRENYIISFYDTKRWMEHTDDINTELYTYSTQDLLKLFRIEQSKHKHFSTGDKK